MPIAVPTSAGRRGWNWLLPFVLATAAKGLWGCSGRAAHETPVVPRNWVVFYGTDTAPESLRGYDVVVLDGGFQGRIDLLKDEKTSVLAYLSLGEVNTQRSYYGTAKDRGLLVAENPNWPGAWMVDVRDPRWQAMLVDEVAADLLGRGFDGLFLDTIDSALYLEETQPQKFAGMRKASITLITRLHERYPQARLLLNGGLPLAGPLKGKVDRLAIESTVTTWDFATGTARWRTPAERAEALQRLQQARKDNPALTIFTLDYWNPTDLAGIRSIYRQQREQGFVPYVATLALDRVVPEPLDPTPVGP